jgi:hypothetical protein
VDDKGTHECGLMKIVEGLRCTKRTLHNRVVRLERILQSRLRHAEDARSAHHEELTGDPLLRMCEQSHDWVRLRVEQVIRQCDGLTPEAKVRLQERLKILQTGSSEEILLEIARLASDTPEWCSDREEEVLAALSRRIQQWVKRRLNSG